MIVSMTQPLTRPILSSLSDAISAVFSGFNPRNLFAANELGAWYDPGDLSTLFQDVSATVPVTKAGQFVRRINDKSGNGFHQIITSDLFKLQRDGTGHYYIQRESGTASYQTSAAANFSSSSKATVICGLSKVSDASQQVVFGLGNYTNPGGFSLNSPVSGGSGDYNLIANGGTTFVQTFTSGFSAPISSVVSGTIDFTLATAEVNLQVDGVQKTASSGDSGPGPFASTRRLGLMGADGATLQFTGRFYGLIIVASLLSQRNLDNAVRWMLNRTKSPNFYEERPIMFGALGDSITRNQYTPSTANSNIVGETYRFTSRCWAAWACQRLGRKAWANVEAFEGWSGYTAAQILAAMYPTTRTRLIGATGAQASIPNGVRAVRPDYCFVMAGTNDLLQGVAQATTVTNIRAIWSALRAEGIEPIAISLLPRDDAFAASVPALNAAISSAATTDGVKFIDIYTNCNNGSGGFKTGWTYINGAPDPQGVHPGNEAAHQIAEDIAASLTSWLPYRNRTPYVKNATTYVVSDGVFTKDIALFDDMGGGIFPTATGWEKRFETGGTTSQSVGADAIAQIGNALTVTYPAPTGVDIYSDRIGPEAIAVTPGAKYALMFRMAFTAGDPGDNITIGIQEASNPGALFWSFTNLDSQTASSSAGASLTERDIYMELTIPPGITSVRPWIVAGIKNGSTGATLKLAQFGVAQVQ